MKSQLTWSNNRISHGPSGRTWKTSLQSLWRKVLVYMTTTDEPKVWKTQTRQGDTLWNAYDPRTGRSTSKASADELRAWLEDRHHPSMG